MGDQHPQLRGSDPFAFLTHAQRLTLTRPPDEPAPVSHFYRDRLPPPRVIEDTEITRQHRLADYRLVLARLTDTLARFAEHLHFHSTEAEAIVGISPDGAGIKPYTGDLASWCRGLEDMMSPERSALPRANYGRPW